MVLLHAQRVLCPLPRNGCVTVHVSSLVSKIRKKIILPMRDTSIPQIWTSFPSVFKPEQYPPGIIYSSSKVGQTWWVAASKWLGGEWNHDGGSSRSVFKEDAACHCVGRSQGVWRIRELCVGRIRIPVALGSPSTCSMEKKKLSHYIYLSTLWQQANLPVHLLQQANEHCSCANPSSTPIGYVTLNLLFSE